VGAMMAVLMGARDGQRLARACDLGVAMQLTNIARDVGEDARLGRLYLPRDWMRQARLDPDAWLANPVFSPELGSVVKRLLSEADQLYARADAGVAVLPPACRPGILAASRLYAAIGAEIAKAGYNSVNQRAHTSGRRKLAVLADAMRRRPHPDAAALHLPPLPETAPLVAAVQAHGPLTDGDSKPAWWRVGDNVMWAVQMLETAQTRRDEMNALAPLMPSRR
jgi:15-cis-phytoene synthase